MGLYTGPTNSRAGLTSWKFPASLCVDPTRTFYAYEASREENFVRHELATHSAHSNVSQVHVTLKALPCFKH